MVLYDENHDDVELGELEDDAFIPNTAAAKKESHTPSIFIRWMPPRLQNFFRHLSGVKLMLIVLVTFILLMLFLGWVGDMPLPVTIPPESIALSAQVAKGLEGTNIPGYVLQYAPLVWLDRRDEYYPSDMALHVSNVHATQNFTHVKGAPNNLTLDNLHELNGLGSGQTYLSSTGNVMDLPTFLDGKKPDPKTLQTTNATSCVIILADKGNGIVDAFYMYFYSFNQGPSALGHEVGDHLGDWEHNMVRFKHGAPSAVWFSQHEYGEAYTYEAVNKAGLRPLSFSAKGTHANYARSGKHDLHKQQEEIPKGVVYDHTSYGKLWDPTLSAYFYTVLPGTTLFATVKPDDPVNYLYFNGLWGDPEYGDDVQGQESFHGFHKWTGGPQGPRFKALDRKDVCLPSNRTCVIKTEL